jgi:hypothetical protein
MKKYMIVLALSICSCGPPAPTCTSGQLLGSDNQCYSCNYGTPEYKSSEFGYCSSVNSGGVACCSAAFYNYGSISCYPNEPWLCSDALCHTTDIGACVYVP